MTGARLDAILRFLVANRLGGISNGQTNRISSSLKTLSDGEMGELIQILGSVFPAVRPDSPLTDHPNALS
jgi:hypothetical protein